MTTGLSGLSLRIACEESTLDRAGHGFGNIPHEAFDCTMPPFEDSFDELVKSMEAVMGSMSSPDFFSSSGRDSWDPKVNVYELKDRIVICVELAGIQPGELDVQVHEGILHIRGHRPKPTMPEEAGPVGVHLMEIDSGKFHRKIPVPSNIDFDQSKANYKNGYVWISLPRRDQPNQPSE